MLGLQGTHSAVGQARGSSVYAVARGTLRAGEGLVYMVFRHRLEKGLNTGFKRQI